MNKYTTITIIVILCSILLIGGGYIAWMMLVPSTEVIDAPSTLVTVDDQQRPTVPLGDSSRDTAPTASLSVSGYTNQTISVRNFLADSDVLKLGKSEDVVLYALGMLPQDSLFIGSTTETLPTAQERGYEILFSETESTFLVHLISEPLGAKRRQVATDLQARLGVDQLTLCNIQIAVIVTAPHPTLRGKYIGLPGCKGALDLPE